MSRREERTVILCAEDDPEDRMLIKDALEEARFGNEVRFVTDGEDLLNYLNCQGKYGLRTPPRPDLILLDLNMPRKDGREALEEIKRDPSWRSIPIIVLTTSEAEDDVSRMYELGVTSYITKPVTFEDLVSAMQALATYWFDVVTLPHSRATV